MHDRREFLRRAGMLGAGLLGSVAVGRPAAAADAALAPFLHGVASGDPLPHGVMLWTRLSGVTDAAAVRWVVARDLGLTDVVASGTATADPASDWTVKVDATGLPAATWLFYGFTEVASGRRSITGRTRTAPEVGATVDHLRFGVVTCSNYGAGFFNAYARLAELDDLDAVVHVGDYLYESAGPAPGSPRAMDPGREIISLSDYRRRYALHHLDPDCRRLHQLFPWITIWDDHESANDSWKDGAAAHDPATEGPWPVRKAASQRAYSEWLPIRTDDPARIYRSLAFGDLVDLILLDTRLDGRDQQVGADLMTVLDGAAIDDPTRNLISPTQRAWLFGALDGSMARGAVWRVIAQQVMVAQLNVGGLPELPLLAPQFGLRSGGNAINPDQWDGYTAERARLFAKLRGYDPTLATAPKPALPTAPANAVRDVVVLTGDIHAAFVADLVEDPYDPAIYDPATGTGALAVEFVTTSVTSTGLETTLGQGVPAAEAAVPAANPHIKYDDLDERGYLVLDITRTRARADFFVVDTVAVPSATKTLVASWEARHGVDGAKRSTGAAPTGTPAPATPGGDPPAPTPTPEVPEVPVAALLPTSAVVAGAVVAGAVAWRRRGDTDATG